MYISTSDTADRFPLSGLHVPKLGDDIFVEHNYALPVWKNSRDAAAA